MNNKITQNGFLKEEYKNLILKAIAYHFEHAKLILFGSRARGTNRPGSDIDLAIDTGQPIKLREMSRIRITLANLPISLEMDIVDMNNISDELKQIILREGVEWKN